MFVFMLKWMVNFVQLNFYTNDTKKSRTDNDESWPIMAKKSTCMWHDILKKVHLGGQS